MRTIARLFGRSPFSPLQTHMKKVSSCVEKLASIFEGLPGISQEEIEAIASQISHLEHEADITKNDIRNHLPKSIFLPIDRSHFLEILSIQDRIADKTEDIGFLLSLSSLDKVDDLQTEIVPFFKKNEAVFRNAQRIINEIDELIESSFGGIEAEKVKAMVETTAMMEHEADRMQKQLMKKLYCSSCTLSPPAFMLWHNLLEEVGSLSHLSEKLANRIRMVLELR